MKEEQTGAHSEFDIWCISHEVEEGDTVNILAKNLTVEASPIEKLRGIYMGHQKGKPAVLLETGITIKINEETLSSTVKTRPLELATKTIAAQSIVYKVHSPNTSHPLRLKDIRQS